MYVLEQGVPVLFQLFDAALHDVADAYDPCEDSILEHGDMTDAVLGHHDGEGLDILIRRGSSYLARHDQPDRFVEKRASEADKRACDVAFGDDSLNCPTVARNDQGTDVMSRHVCHRRRYRRVWADRCHCRALAL